MAFIVLKPKRACIQGLRETNVIHSLTAHIMTSSYPESVDARKHRVSHMLDHGGRSHECGEYSYLMC